MVRTHAFSGNISGRIGIVAPFDMYSALAHYASQLKRCLPAPQVRVLTEDLASELLREKGADVIQCFLRGSNDISRLRAAVVEHDIKILHVLLHQPFFSANVFLPFIKEIQSRGGRVIVEVHEPAQVDENVLGVLRHVDRVVVFDEQFGFELMAQGISHEKLCTLRATPHQASAVITENEARSALGMRSEERLLAAFTGARDAVELGKLLEAVERVRAGQPNLRLLLVPQESIQHAQGSNPQLDALNALCRNDRPWLSVHQRSASIEDLRKVLAASTAAVFLPGRPSLELCQSFLNALSLRCAVVAPQSGPFVGHFGRVFYLNQRVSLAQALSAVLGHASVREALSNAAGQWAETHSWEEHVHDITELLSEVGKQSTTKTSSVGVPARTATPRTPRVLMQSRENAYAQPGGDTVVMDRISEGLRARGMIVDIDTRGEKNPRDYDLVHLFNFAMKEHTERLARHCSRMNVPYVVTTLYEDWPLFFNQMNAHYAALESYLSQGQPRERWPELLRQAKAARPSPIWDNSLTANDSAVLIATGRTEAAALRRDYPAAKQVEICHLGADGFEFQDGGEMFRKETGLQDFVLCVGRFELRKNQLMLLKALEDSDLTVVFAGGGFSYQPAYAEACRRFQRRGKTVFLDRLEPKMLASAFQAAKVHALPGWLELPGLVSLEAARCGTNVVVTDYGTSRDYLEDYAYYCKPDDPETIRNSVTAAFYAPPKPGLSAHARTFTWDRAAVRSGELYQTVLASRGDFDWSFLRETRVAPVPQQESVHASLETASLQAKAAGQSVGMIPVVVAEPSDGPKPSADAKRLCDEGDILAKSGDSEGAKQQYLAAVKRAPNFARSYRSCGALELNAGRLNDAEEYFHKALSVDPDDSRSLLGLGSVRWEQDKREEAFELYLKGAQKNPTDALAVLHLVRTAYALNRLADLEQALRAFLKTDPDNINVLYCLAGCSYRRERLFLAQSVVDRILKLDPEHADARELRQKIQEDLLSARTASVNGAAAPQGSVSSTAMLNDAFDAAAARFDERLKDLENDKRNRDWDTVVNGCQKILDDTGATGRHREHAKVLRAEALACKGEIVDADRVFSGIEMTSEFGYRALAGRGAVSAAEGDLTAAKQYFHRTLEIQPDYDVALAGLGLCSTADGDNERAWEYYQRALKVNPENRRALYGVIQLGYAMNRLQGTAKAIETYLEYHPVDLSMNYSYAGCCYALGEREKALAECKKILLFDPTHRHTVELVEKIESELKQAAYAR